ncbi:hypothetical protein CVU83_01915 [Candidatus Falkowbacteria bacterium HGW-Falkowbacteria-2]|uniref:Uncharacterized protein n=1 Tax=Candidatus Falkowbacteria bacterium HGW-Falkowbacteria-2 TaxID=2013769 RepID=A0A2N2E0T9_9BACT|nr:MAG: hypothetical protein CVU83_01915 [Candidatus Falkowbacteria bacterium HGW-Falkowbacteria-2]
MNDQQREVKELTTPSGKKLEIKTYVTARERNEIRDAMLPFMNVDTATNKVDDKISGDVLVKAEPKLIEVIVSSFDGSSEKVLDRILDGSPEDYDFIVKNLKFISDGKGNLNQAKPTISGSDTSPVN